LPMRCFYFRNHFWINLVANGFFDFETRRWSFSFRNEHHSNIVPWQMLCERTGATLKVIPMNDNGELIMAEYEIAFGQN
jgi:cysteine desulfurase/selenocysteine lyase